MDTHRSPRRTQVMYDFQSSADRTGDHAERTLDLPSEAVLVRGQCQSEAPHHMFIRAPESQFQSEVAHQMLSVKRGVNDANRYAPEDARVQCTSAV